MLGTFINGPVGILVPYILKSIKGEFQSNTVSCLEGEVETLSASLKALHKMSQELYISIPANIFASPHP
jgi:hypothetical protein